MRLRINVWLLRLYTVVAIGMFLFPPTKSQEYVANGRPWGGTEGYAYLFERGRHPTDYSRLMLQYGLLTLVLVAASLRTELTPTTPVRRQGDEIDSHSPGEYYEGPFDEGES